MQSRLFKVAYRLGLTICPSELDIRGEISIVMFSFPHVPSQLLIESKLTYSSYFLPVMDCTNEHDTQSLTFNVFGFAQFRLKGCLVMLSLTSLRFLKLNKDLRVQS